MQLTVNKGPGFWRAPIKARTIFRTGAILFALFVIAIWGLWTIIFFSMKPPKEKKLIENFQAHRAAYDQLREMLLADRSVRAVYTRFGVETTNSGWPHKPDEVNFPVSRYNQYVGLLEKVGSEAAFRIGENQPEFVCVGAWGAGWAGDTRHVWVCWADREPANQVANLDNYYSDAKRPRDVFRHIAQNWYLRADW